MPIPAFLRQVTNEVMSLDREATKLPRLTFHLAPPLFARRDKTTGEPRKMSFGPWMMGVFRVLAKFKFLRGTPLDPFGYTDERRTERQLVRDYEALLDELMAQLTPDNHHLAVGLAAIPEKIRGFGHVKLRHLKAAESRRGGAARPVPLRRSAAAEGGGIAHDPEKLQTFRIKIMRKTEGNNGQAQRIPPQSGRARRRRSGCGYADERRQGIQS